MLAEFAFKKRFLAFSFIPVSLKHILRIPYLTTN